MKGIKIMKRVLIRILILAIPWALIQFLLPEMIYFTNLFGHAALGIIIGMEMEYGPLSKKSISIKVLVIFGLLALFGGISYFLFQHFNWGAFVLGFLSGPFLKTRIAGS